MLPLTVCARDRAAKPVEFDAAVAKLIAVRVDAILVVGTGVLVNDLRVRLNMHTAARSLASAPLSVYRCGARRCYGTRCS
jgi:hypothetical protein